MYVFQLNLVIFILCGIFKIYHNHKFLNFVVVDLDHSDFLPFAFLGIQSIQDSHFVIVEQNVDHYKIFKYDIFFNDIR